MNNDKMMYGYGIYGIYCDGELVYIGMTEQSFMKRYESYLEDLKDITKYRPVISFIRQNRETHNIEFKPLVNVMELKLVNKNEVKTRDIQMMELTLISLYKPVLNIQGVITNYPLRKKAKCSLNF